MNASEITDLEILTAYRKVDGHDLAMRLLIRKYGSRLYQHIRKMLIDHEESDEVLQICMIKAWKGLANFRSESGLFTWLYRIASNECISHLNKKKRFMGIPIYNIKEELLQKVDQSLLPDAAVIEGKLQKAILELPDKQRLVFNMRHYDALTYEQISDILGTSVGGLKASYHLAQKKIEKYLSTS